MDAEGLHVGLLFVLVFWAVVLCVIGAPLAWWVKARAAASGDVARDRRVGLWLVAFVFLGGAYAFCCLLIYGIACDMRGVDIGIGDSWTVPLCQGHVLGFTDVPENASLRPGPDGGEAIVSHITEMGEDGPYVFGDGFILDTRNGKLTHEPDRATLLRDLARLGIDHPRFVSAWAFYTWRRWTLIDLVILLLLGGTGALVTFSTFRMAWNGPPCPGDGTGS